MREDVSDSESIVEILQQMPSQKLMSHQRRRKEYYQEPPYPTLSNQLSSNLFLSDHPELGTSIDKSQQSTQKNKPKQTYQMDNKQVQYFDNKDPSRIESYFFQKSYQLTNPEQFTKIRKQSTSEEQFFSINNQQDISVLTVNKNSNKKKHMIFEKSNRTEDNQLSKVYYQPKVPETSSSRQQENKNEIQNSEGKQKRKIFEPISDVIAFKLPLCFSTKNKNETIELKKELFLQCKGLNQLEGFKINLLQNQGILFCDGHLQISFQRSSLGKITLRYSNISVEQIEKIEICDYSDSTIEHQIDCSSFVNLQPQTWVSQSITVTPLQIPFTFVELNCEYQVQSGQQHIKLIVPISLLNFCSFTNTDKSNGEMFKITISNFNEERFTLLITLLTEKQLNKDMPEFLVLVKTEYSSINTTLILQKSDHKVKLLGNRCLQTHLLLNLIYYILND